MPDCDKNVSTTPSFALRPVSGISETALGELSEIPKSHPRLIVLETPASTLGSLKHLHHVIGEYDNRADVKLDV